jgi:hypothetical protein
MDFESSSEVEQNVARVGSDGISLVACLFDVVSSVMKFINVRSNHLEPNQLGKWLDAKNDKIALLGGYYQAHRKWHGFCGLYPDKGDISVHKKPVVSKLSYWSIVSRHLNHELAPILSEDISVCEKWFLATDTYDGSTACIPKE